MSSGQAVLAGRHFLLGDHAVAGAPSPPAAASSPAIPSPSTEIAERLAHRLPEAGGIFVQMEAELARREQKRPRQLTREERETIQALGSDLERVWSAPTTLDRDRKELLRRLL